MVSWWNWLCVWLWHEGIQKQVYFTILIAAPNLRVTGTRRLYANWESKSA